MKTIPPSKLDYLHALNEAAASIQRAAHAKTAVYEAFAQQLIKLNMIGTISIWHDLEQEFEIKRIAMTPNALTLVKMVERAMDVNSIGFRYTLHPNEQTAINKGEPLFVTDNESVIWSIIRDRAGPYMKFVLKMFGSFPTILAPIMQEGQLAGVLYVGSHQLTPDDTATFAAFANHISVALENAHLFEEMQSARLQLQQMNESMVASQQALSYQINLLNTILSAIDLFITVQDLNGRFIYVSPSFEKHFGINTNNFFEKIGESLIYSPTDLATSLSWREEVIQTGEVRSGQFNILQFNVPRVSEFSIYPLKNEAGEIIGTVSNMVDITDHIKTEQALSHARRIESLGLMAGGIAHDFNNLLLAMMGQAELAKYFLTEQNPSYKHVDRVINVAKKAANLTHQLLAYSGKSQPLLEPMNLNELLHESTNLFKTAVSEQTQLDISLTKPLPFILADRNQIQQIILNLVINASESITAPNGRVHLQTGSIELKPPITQCVALTQKQLKPGHYVQLTVEDNGVGMDPETQQRIFEPFFTTKFTGRGLGLATVLGILQAHSGSIDVKSRPNNGTLFTLLLPTAPTPPIDSQQPAITRLDNQLLPQKVLVIDDEQWVVEAIEQLLAINHIEVLTANSGQQGLALFAEHAASIEVILLDLAMPSMPGIEVLTELQQLDASIPVILISGYSEADIRQQYQVKSQSVSFLQKPFELPDLMHLLQEALAPQPPSSAADEL